MGGSNTFEVKNPVVNLTKIKSVGISKTRVVSELSESSNTLDFILANVNHKDRTFEVNY